MVPPFSPPQWSVQAVVEETGRHPGGQQGPSQAAESRGLHAAQGPKTPPQSSKGSARRSLGGTRSPVSAPRFLCCACIDGGRAGVAPAQPLARTPAPPVWGDGERHYAPFARAAFGCSRAPPPDGSWRRGHCLTDCPEWALISGKVPSSYFLTQVCNDSFFSGNQLTAKGNLTLFLPFSRQKLA